MAANILEIALGVSLSSQYSPGGPTPHGQSPEGPTVMCNHLRITPATFRLYMLGGRARNFPLPTFFPDILGLWELPGSSGCSANCCRRPTSPVSMNLAAASRLKKRAWNQQITDINGFVNGEACTSEKSPEGHPTVCRQTAQATGRRGRFAALGSEVRWDHWLPGKPAGGHAPHFLFDQ